METNLIDLLLAAPQLSPTGDTDAGNVQVGQVITTDKVRASVAGGKPVSYQQYFSAV
jgi:hypothetical protein